MTLQTALQTIALAGNPNSGKTTIFNALTGLRQKTGNYPGVTVEKRLGRCRLTDTTTVDVVDLPGTYSLISGSPDEKVAVDVLTGRIVGTPKPDAVIVVIDASNLQRNLYLVSQLIEMRVRMVIALNMMDVAERRGLRVQAELLQAKLRVPVVPIVGHKARGIEMLKRAIPNAAVAAEPEWPLPEIFRRAITTVASEVGPLAERSSLSPRACAERLLVGETLAGTSPELAAIVERQRELLITAGVDPMQADVEAHYQWIESIAHAAVSPTVDLRVRGRSSRGTGFQPVSSTEEHGSKAQATHVLDYAPRASLTDRADRILLHKVWGLIAFAAIMAGLFAMIFFAAAPLMDATEGAIGFLGGHVAGWLPEGPIKDMWSDAIVAGVGGVLVFVPQIAILFGLLAILEDSGYLARAAFLMDRLLGKVGLSGKAFVPLLSGFACAIPGVMATRTIASPRDRLRTIFVLPFMSCSARLPVYTLLIGAFFAGNAWWVRGGIMLGLYLLGIAAAFATAWIWKRRSHEAVSSFIMELPSYKVPQASTVARVMFTNTRAFVTKAGTIIFALSVLLWATTYWPRLPEAEVTATKEDFIQRIGRYNPLSSLGYAPRGLFEGEADAALNDKLRLDTTRDKDAYEAIWNEEQIPHAHLAHPATYLPTWRAKLEEASESAVASAQLRYSLAGRFGHLIEPAIKPLGFDWKMGVGMVGAFGAREVFVSTMGIVYAAGDSEDDPQPLETAMQNDKYADGHTVWRPLVAINMLVWFVLAMQCLSTVAIVKRETGGWKWPLLQLAYMNGLAYVVCLVIYQVGKAMGG